MSSDALYPSALLALAADIPHLGRLPEAEARARKRSMVCGSEVEVALSLDAEGRIAALGLDVEACALGQASASVFARAAIGATAVEVAAARDALRAMLKNGGGAPSGRFAGLEALKVVIDFPRRHASTLLVWDAAVAAIDAAFAVRSEISPEALTRPGR